MFLLYIFKDLHIKILSYPTKALRVRFMKNPAEYSAINGGDECGAGVRGMQSPST